MLVQVFLSVHSSSPLRKALNLRRNEEPIVLVQDVYSLKFLPLGIMRYISFFYICGFFINPLITKVNLVAFVDCYLSLT